MTMNNGHHHDWQPPDQEQRERALDTRASFIVQAPAGSGKTGLLVQRYLALLAQVDEPEEILAITFTRKATGEMRERVLNALQAAAAPLAATADTFARRTWQLARAAHQRDEARGWRLAEHPSRLRILTIDALNASLTRQLPLLAGFGSAPQITDQALELYRAAARRTLRGDGLDDSAYAPVQHLLDHLDGDYQQSEELLAGMLAGRQQWRLFLHFDEHDRELLENALRRESETQLEQLAAQLRPWRDVLLRAAVCAGDTLNAGSNTAKLEDLLAWAGRQAWPPPQAEALPLWRGLATLLLTGKGEWRKTWNIKVGIPASAKALKEELAAAVAAMSDSGGTLLGDLQRVQVLPPAQYHDAQWQLLAAVVHVLRVALAHLQLVFQERGLVDHPEVALRALQALGDDDQPTDLALKLDYRIQHVLVDEFQDTSRPQVALLQRITAGWEPGDGRTLFLVGDPMQSIYRFRQAEVGLFLQARRQGLGPVTLQALNLSTNFRSRPAIVQWVNQVFAQLFPRQDDFAGSRVAYTASSAAGPLPAGVEGEDTGQEEAAAGAVQVHPLFTDSDDKAAAREQEAAAVADRVAQHLAATDDGDVAVLVRRRQDLACIIPALRRAGLAFEAVEIEQLTDQAVVQDLYALTRALLHGADQVAWLAVLRAPWCGLELPALQTIQELEGPWFSRLQQAAAHWGGANAQRLQRVLPVLQHAYAQRRRAPLRMLVENTWRRLGGAACLREARERADADAFFALLEEVDNAGDCGDPPAVAERLAGLYARPDTSPQAARVKLMTVHKAKGLEFSRVILPALERGRGQAERGLLLWQERPRGGQQVDLLLGPLQAKGDDQDAIQHYVRQVDKEQTHQEQLRLLYVATTRARHHLHLFATVNTSATQDTAAVLKPPAKGSLLHELWPVVADTFHHAWRRQLARQTSSVAAATAGGQRQVQLFGADGRANDDAVGQGRRYRRLPAAWVPPVPPAAPRWQRRAMPRDAVDATPFAWAGMRARYIGTVVHAWLERIADTGLEHWGEARIAAEQPLISHRLRLLGMPDENLEQAAARVTLALQKILSDVRGRWILGHHTEAYCEYALNAWLDGRLQTLIIDRTFVDEQGVCWIIDYKTSAYMGGTDGADDKDNANINAFLNDERDRYREQLQTYAKAMAAIKSSAISTALYFPLMQSFIAVDYFAPDYAWR